RDKLVTGVQTCALPIWDVAELTRRVEQLSAAVAKLSTAPGAAPAPAAAPARARAAAAKAPAKKAAKKAAAKVPAKKAPGKRPARSEERRVGKECRGGWG